MQFFFKQFTLKKTQMTQTMIMMKRLFSQSLTYGLLQWGLPLISPTPLKHIRTLKMEPIPFDSSIETSKS